MMAKLRRAAMGLTAGLLASCGGGAGPGGGGASTTTSTAASTTGKTSAVTAVAATTAATGTGGAASGVDISAGSPGPNQSETSVASAPGGIVAAAWINDDVPSIGYAFSTDDGKTWLSPQVASPTDGFGYGDPTLVTASDGSIDLAFTGFNMGFTKGTVYVARAAPGATTFDAPVLVTPPAEAGPFDKPVIAITKSNALLVTYTDFTSGKMVAARSADGTTWTHSPVAPNDAGATFATACPDPGGGRVWIVYYTQSFVGLTWSDDDGVTFPAANKTVVSAANETDISVEDPVCVGKGQDVWVAYGRSHDSVNSVDFNFKDYAIRVAHSADAGKTIAGRVDAGDAMAAPFFMEPALVLEDGGALDIAYYAGTADADPMSSWRRARSTDGGQTFGASAIVFSPLILGDARSAPTWIGDYSGLAVRGTLLYTTFADNEGGHAQVSFANIPLP